MVEALSRTQTIAHSILIDTREQTPLVFPDGITTKRCTLQTGDYSVEGYKDEFAIERKSLTDLVNTVIHQRDRFERELERMRQYPFRRLLIIAPWADVLKGDYSFSMANGKSVMASVTAFEMRYDVPAVFVKNVGEATQRVLWWARYYVREKNKQKKEIH